MLERLRQFEGSEIAKERIKIIEFYERYGEKATKEAFGADRKVISRWKKRLKENNIVGLIPISTRPNRLRQSKIDERIIEKISYYFAHSGILHMQQLECSNSMSSLYMSQMSSKSSSFS